MDHHEIAKYNCFRSIESFGAAHRDIFPVAGFAGALFTRLGQVVASLEELGANQVSANGASRQSTVSKAVARSRLAETLELMNLAANAMGLSTPGFESKFRRPRKTSDATLLNAARAFHADAAPLQADFISFGMSAGFIDELASDIAEFERATDQQQTHVQSGVSATAGLDETIEEGLALRHQLNAIVRITLREDRALLAAWQSASHIEHPGRGSRVVNPTPQPIAGTEAPPPASYAPAD